MTPQNSTIGYMQYGPTRLPITDVTLRRGLMYLYSFVTTDIGEEVSVNPAGPFSVYGADGALMFGPVKLPTPGAPVDHHGEPYDQTASDGGVLRVEQSVRWEP